MERKKNYFVKNDASNTGNNMSASNTCIKGLAACLPAFTGLTILDNCLAAFNTLYSLK